jgi:hypothetical protein
MKLRKVGLFYEKTKCLYLRFGKVWERQRYREIRDTERLEIQRDIEAELTVKIPSKAG